MLMAAVIIGLSISNLLFFQLYRGTANEYAQFSADVSAAQEAIRLDNERKLQALAETNRQVADDYAKARAALAAGPRVVRVRDTCSGSGILPTPAAPASGLDATAETRTITAEQCEAYLADGLADAQQLTFLQQWAIKTHEASK
jgi:hypothetical protein